MALRSVLIRLVAAAVALLGAPPHLNAAAPSLPTRILIASEGARPPYNYLDGDTLEGFEIDLGADLCRRMKISCKFVSGTWDEMIPDLLAGRFDAIMAAMEITARRQAQIAFSTPYVKLPSAFLALKSTDLRAATPEALAGRRIGVEQGGTHQTFLEKVYPDAKTRLYATLGDAILDLEAGRVDVVLGDKDAVVTFLETRRDASCCRILADVPRDPVYFGDGIGVGLRKEDTALKAAFDKAISEATADGSLARIAARYFSFPIIGLPVGRMVDRP